jgi:hypothetical protein
MRIYERAIGRRRDQAGKKREAGSEHRHAA